MERRDFSIEPYVDGGGILGAYLQVNEKAANSVMKRTALRRDVAVTKGYGRESVNVVGSQELAVVLSKSLFPGSERLNENPASVLVRTPTKYIIMLNDQQLADNVDEWMTRQFEAGKGKTGPEVFRQRFALSINSAVDSLTYKAFWNEKKDIFLASSSASVGLYIHPVGIVGGLGWHAWNLYEVFSQHFLKSGHEFQAIYLITRGFIGAAAAIYVSGLISRFLHHEIAEQGLDEFIRRYRLNLSEIIVPNPQIPSIVSGSISLSLNGNKLLKLKS